MMERSIFSAKYIFVENLFRRYGNLIHGSSTQFQLNYSDGFCCTTQPCSAEVGECATCGCDLCTDREDGLLFQSGSASILMYLM